MNQEIKNVLIAILNVKVLKLLIRIIIAKNIIFYFLTINLYKSLIYLLKKLIV